MNALSLPAFDLDQRQLPAGQAREERVLRRVGASRSDVLRCRVRMSMICSAAAPVAVAHQVPDFRQAAQFAPHGTHVQGRGRMRR
ncbi:hypothetical protein [Ralstonia solanacearum]|uniref:hypothetical protein n=1 Tax=Ralstonia solanacearum TaxID=305 RepID=UPI001FFCBDA5|nr:hypothetical protein [Ralstonia solanacearum]